MRQLPIGHGLQLRGNRICQVGITELDGIEFVEREPPDRQPRGRRQQQPVQEPQRARILHVGVPALLAEERMAPESRHELWRPPVGGVWVLGDQLGRESPEADGPNHVLAHADDHRRVLPAEGVGVLGRHRSRPCGTSRSADGTSRAERTTAPLRRTASLGRLPCARHEDSPPLRHEPGSVYRELYTECRAQIASRSGRTDPQNCVAVRPDFLTST